MRSRNGRRQRLDVARRAAGDRRPARAVAEAEHPVVGEELGEEAHREASRRWRGSADHTAETCGTISRSTNAREKRWRERKSCSDSPLSSRSSRRAQRAVEAQQVDDHPLEARAGEVGRLAEQPARRAAVLEVLLLALDREAHVRRLARARRGGRAARVKLRVVAVVQHDEAGVDVMCLVRACRRGSCSCARRRSRVGLVHDDLVLAVQQVRGDEPGDAGADDRDPHRLPPFACLAARRISLAHVRAAASAWIIRRRCDRSSLERRCRRSCESLAGVRGRHVEQERR